jgi:hypothetical protein
LLPRDPVRNAAILRVRTERTERIPTLAAEPAEKSPDQTQPRITLAAAWLCEVLDNYLMLESGDAAHTVLLPPPAYATSLTSAGASLGRAMGAMGDADWASLDGFPDLARRIRIATDRLHEQFRASVAPPASASAVPFSWATIESTLAEAAFLPVTPPSLFPSGADDLVTRRNDMTVVIHRHSLADTNWYLSAGGLGPWRSASGTHIVSPVRLLWQRIALLRALAPVQGTISGLVLLVDGIVEDEAGVARSMAQGYGKTAVAIVWQEGTGCDLPGLREWLQQLGKHSNDPAREQ